MGREFVWRTFDTDGVILGDISCQPSKAKLVLQIHGDDKTHRVVRRELPMNPETKVSELREFFPPSVASLFRVSPDELVERFYRIAQVQPKALELANYAIEKGLAGG